MTREDNHLPTSNADAVDFQFQTGDGLFTIVLAEDWFLYLEDQDGMMWYFNTELWYEWANVDPHQGVWQMAQYCYLKRPLKLTECHKWLNKRQFKEDYDNR